MSIFSTQVGFEAGVSVLIVPIACMFYPLPLFSCTFVVGYFLLFVVYSYLLFIRVQLHCIYLQGQLSPTVS